MLIAHVLCSLLCKKGWVLITPFPHCMLHVCNYFFWEGCTNWVLRHDHVEMQGRALRAQFWSWNPLAYKGVSKSFQTGCLEQELQMVQLSATKCSCITILWVSLVISATITLCVASQWKIPKVVYTSLLTQSRNFWICCTLLNLWERWCNSVVICARRMFT
jgi:hypothetical protein